MKIQDSLTQSIARTVQQVIEENKDVKLSEGKMKELHALMQKGMKDPKKIAKELGLSGKKAEDAIAQLIKKEANAPGAEDATEDGLGKGEKDFKDAHAVNTIDDVEQKKQSESTEVDEEILEGHFKVSVPGMPPFFIEAGSEGEVKKNMKAKVKPDVFKEISVERATKSDMQKTFKGLVKGETSESHCGDDRKDEELSAKQKKIDLNKNGKIDGDDLAQLRKKKDEDVTNDEEDAIKDNEKNLKKSLPKQTKVESYTEEFGEVILLDLSEGKEDMSSATLQVSDPKKVHKQWHGITSIRVAMTKYDDEVKISGKKKDLLRVLPKLGYDKNDIEDMYSHLLEGLTEALSKNDKTAGYAGRGQFELKRHIMPLVDKNKSLKDVYFDGPDLVGDTKKGKQPTIAKGVLTDKKMTVGDLEKVIKNFKESTNYSEEIISKILEKKNSELDEIEEAIQPGEFIKGGDKKISLDDVDDIAQRIILNNRLMKQLEKSKPFKDGKASKGKKKNTYKKDTIDFHHYELGVQAGQAGF